MTKEKNADNFIYADENYHTSTLGVLIGFCNGLRLFSCGLLLAFLTTIKNTRAGHNPLSCEARLVTKLMSDLVMTVADRSKGSVNLSLNCAGKTDR